MARRRPDSGGGGGFVAGFVRHRNAANLLMILMLLAGAFALARMQTQYFPTVEVPRVTISVAWPGASAEDVEVNILQAVQAQVRFLDDVTDSYAYAREGSGTVSLEYDPSADMQKALREAEAAINSITTFPENAEDPEVSHRRWYESVAKVALYGPFTESALRAFARQVRDDLLDAGVERVSFEGMRTEEIRVEAQTADLRRLGLTLEDISTRIAEETRDVPAGSIEGAVERQIRSVAQANTPEDFARLPLRSQGTGERITVGDVADVGLAYDDDQPVGYIGNDRAIQINVQRSASADTLATARILDEYLERVRPTLPPTLNLVKYDQRSDRLMERINLLVNNGLTGLVLVVVILFVFLNARIALWVAAGIPVAVMATLAIMWMSGQSINMMSLFALILTLGIVVDDAIVVGEHTATVRERGADPAEAAERGVNRMLMPVTAASLTTMASFLPLLLVSDHIGRLTSALPLVVVAVLTASLIESFLILPSHLRHSLSRAGQSRRILSLDGVRGTRATAWLLLAACLGLIAALGLALAMLTAGEPGGLIARATALAFSGGIDGYLALLGLAAGAVLLFMLLVIIFEGLGARGLFNRVFDAFRAGPVHWLSRLSFRWRYVTVSVAIALLAVSLGLFSGRYVNFVFFSSPEAENISADIIFGAGTPREQVLEALRQINANLEEVEIELAGEKGALVAATYATLGKSGRVEGDNVAEMDVQLTASESRDIRTREIVNAWDRSLPQIPGVEQISVSGRGGGPPGRDLDIRLTGAEATVLKEAAVAMRDMIEEYPGVTGAGDDMPYGKQELVLELTDRGRAMGFTVDEVGNQVRNAFQGNIAKRFARGEDEITVRVMHEEDSRGMAGLLSLYLRNGDGVSVPLSEVVTIRNKAGFSMIRHRDGERAIAVTADVDTEQTSPSDLVAQLQGPVAEIAAQYGVQYDFSGREEERERSFSELQLGVVVALGLIYLILAWVFSSYVRPLAVMVIVPFGIVGAVLGHWLMGYNLSIMSYMALLGLAGILVNDSIILVSRLDERLAEGEELEDAAVGAAQDRLRAVLLTSLTTIGGLLPLMFEGSIQAQFLLPMATTLVFGLGIATLLVLFLVPAVVGIGEDIRRVFAAIYPARPRLAPGE